MASVTTTKENKEIVRRFAETFVNGGNYDTAEEFLAEDIVDSTPLGVGTGRDAVVNATREVRTAFPDFSVTLHELVADGDMVAVRMTQRGTHEGVFMGNEPTGKIVRNRDHGFRATEEREDRGAAGQARPPRDDAATRPRSTSYRRTLNRYNRPAFLGSPGLATAYGGLLITVVPPDLTGSSGRNLFGL